MVQLNLSSPLGIFWFHFSEEKKNGALCTPYRTVKASTTRLSHGKFKSSIASVVAIRTSVMTTNIHTHYTRKKFKSNFVRRLGTPEVTSAHVFILFSLFTNKIEQIVSIVLVNASKTVLVCYLSHFAHFFSFFIHPLCMENGNGTKQQEKKLLL